VTPFAMHKRRVTRPRWRLWRAAAATVLACAGVRTASEAAAPPQASSETIAIDLHDAGLTPSPFTAAVFGLALGARVVRGPDWAYGDQDAGGAGTVTALRPWRGADAAALIGARVTWDATGASNTYRWAKDGAPRDVRVIGWSANSGDAGAGATRLQGEAEPRQGGVADGAQPASAATVQALAALYRALGGEQWRHARGWDAWLRPAHPAPDGAQPPPQERGDARPDPCQERWEGVTCHRGEVVSLDLSNNNARGVLPAAVAQLGHMQSLNLAGNALSGAPPPALCRLAHLRWLSLRNNAMSGQVPACLATALAQLETLELDGNALTGAVPPGFGALPGLRLLHLHANAGLTGPLPPDLVAAPSTLRSL
jgi:hypothetical protein